jgi:hypothetical protein
MIHLYPYLAERTIRGGHAAKSAALKSILRQLA